MKLHLIATKKYGGDVPKGMSGKLGYLIGVEVMGAHNVLKKTPKSQISTKVNQTKNSPHDDLFPIPIYKRVINPGFFTVDMFPCTAGVDLFPCCVDIHGIVSTHVETVVLMSRADAKV